MDNFFDSYPGIKFVFLIYAVSFVLYVALPGRNVEGYCCDENNKRLKYKLNGFSVAVVVTALFVQLPSSYLSIFYSYHLQCLFAANIFGLAMSALFFIVGGNEPYVRCVTFDQVDKLKSLAKSSDFPQPSAAQRFYLGHIWNPRILFGLCDVKMLFYCVGAVVLWLNILSATFVLYLKNGGTISMGMLTYLICFGWFIFEYMLGEEVHLYTYDLFAEKMGFKLSWGCLVFYPFFYCIGVHSIVLAPLSSDISVYAAVAICTLFFVGWSITRGANMQKFFFRTQPNSKTFLFGLVKQDTVPGSKILCSGWWGIARHFNYCGEIIQGIALALPGFVMILFSRNEFLTTSTWVIWLVLPWLYPLYYIALFVSRQIDDEEVCRRKYGEIWEEYTRRVPYRICPGLY